MSNELTEQQQQALDAARDAPAQATLSGTHTMMVLLPAEDFDWVRGVLKGVAEVPRRTDPRTGKSYALVPLDEYERFKAFFEEDPLTARERAGLLREFGRRAGWDDPELDVYESYRDRP